MTVPFRIVEAGDAALIVAFELPWDATANACALAAAAALQQASLPGVRDIVPTYRSVGIYVDPAHLSPHLAETVCRVVTAARQAPVETSAPLDIPVCYGGEFGPDLGAVAAYAHGNEADVIEMHVGRTYRVGMLGFMPGFAYLSEVDARMAMPRRAVPRTRVVAGSVGVAGTQTGIYPFESPGGWQIIGRSPVRLCDFSTPSPFLLSPGMQVRFRAIDADAFARLAEAMA